MTAREMQNVKRVIRILETMKNEIRTRYIWDINAIDRILRMSAPASVEVEKLKAQGAVEFMEKEYLDGRGVPDLAGWKGCMEHLLRKARDKAASVEGEGE